MANISAAAPAAPGEFRVGHVFNQTVAVLSRNFLIFFMVMLVASGPRALFLRDLTRPNFTYAVGMSFLGIVLWIVLYVLAQAVLLYGAFQDMRRRPVNLGECLKIGLRRFFPLIGLAICFMIALGAIFVVPIVLTGVLSRSLSVTGLVGQSLSVTINIIGALVGVGLAALLLTMWYVATPVCVVEQKAPLASLGRSSEITKGHRWKIFGMILLLLIIGLIVGGAITVALRLTGSIALVTLGSLVWNGVWGAFYAIFVAVTYHDLRVAKEGVDTDQIASVFD